MCSPDVIHAVHNRIQKEGRPAMNRRDFLRLGGLAAAGAVASTGVGRALAGQMPVERSRLFQMGQVIDLSHVLGTHAPTFPSFNPPHRGTIYTVADNGFYAQVWTFAEHTGTHMDAPGHFIADGQLVDELDPTGFIAPAIVIDIAARAEEDPDAFLTLEDLQAWESEHGEIPPGALVCMYSGWETRFDDIAAFRGTDENGGLHFPGFHADAAQFLIEERDIVGIGVDTLSLDNGPSATFDVHYTILGAGKYGLENLANLSLIKDQDATVFVGIPRYEAGSGGPCRVLAMVAS